MSSRNITNTLTARVLPRRSFQSVIAQMLEANPNLTPQQIKKILISTAERLPHYEVDRQGWGVIDPRLAVEMALSLM